MCGDMKFYLWNKFLLSQPHKGSWEMSYKEESSLEPHKHPWEIKMGRNILSTVRQVLRMQHLLIKTSKIQ